MKKHLMMTTLCCLAAGAALPAAAGATGWYLDLNGGMNSRENADDELAEAIFDNGTILGAAVGYRFSDLSAEYGPLRNLRLELAYNRQFNDIDKLRLHPNPAINNTQEASGSIDTESIQHVLYYDLPLNRMVPADSFWAGFTPYVGVGLGFNRSILDGLSCDIIERYSPVGDYPLDYETKWSFSYSFRAGVSYALNPQWSIYTGGYYLKVDDHVVIEAPDAERDATHNASGLQIATHPPVETSGMVVGVRFQF